MHHGILKDYQNSTEIRNKINSMDKSSNGYRIY